MAASFRPHAPVTTDEHTFRGSRQDVREYTRLGASTAGRIWVNRYPIGLSAPCPLSCASLTAPSSLRGFMQHYHALLESTGTASSEIGASRAGAGTVDHAVITFLKHEDFTRGLSKATQDTWRPIL